MEGAVLLLRVIALTSGCCVFFLSFDSYQLLSTGASKMYMSFLVCPVAFYYLFFAGNCSRFRPPLKENIRDIFPSIVVRQHVNVVALVCYTFEYDMKTEKKEKCAQAD
jgi:hypothetical protein